MSEFERGETVGFEQADREVTFITSDGSEAWVKWPKGSRATVNLDDLRKLPPPFAVVRPWDLCHGVFVGDLMVNFFQAKHGAESLAAAINTAYAARLEADRKAGAK